MTEAQPQTEQTETEEVHTERDLQFEELTKRLDALEAQNKELKEANQGLWAQLHPAAQAQTPQEPVKAGPSDVDYLYKSLGIKEE